MSRDTLRLSDRGGGGGEGGGGEEEPDLESGLSSLDESDESGVDDARSALLASVKAQASAHRARLGDTGHTLADVDASLTRTVRALVETERFGVATGDLLVAQREQFERQKAQLSLTNEHLTRSKNLLQRMQHRVVTDKILQTAIILCELAAIALIIYFKYYA